VSRLRHRYVSPYLVALALILSATSGVGTGWAAQGTALEDLAGPLRTLAVAAARGEVLPFAFPLPAKGPEDMVLVVVEFRSEAAAANTSLAPYGGQVQIRRDRRVQALLPASSLSAVAGLPQVSQVRPPRYMYPLQGYGANYSEGVQLCGATAYHAAGMFGAGADVAILDMGFADYANAEIPPGVSTISFASGGTMGTDYHGTACAEIVADMAPMCNMTLIAVDTDMSVEMATEYVVNQGFDVSLMSLGSFGGPYDGTHPESQEVNRARAAGLFWVNSAGNHAERHYQGQFTDADGDGLNEFGGGDETIDVYLFPGVFQAFLSWYQTTPTGLTNHDFDLVLVDGSDAEIARSGYSQNGDDPPADALLATIAVEGQYGLKIEYYAGPANPGDFFQLFLPDYDVETQHQVPESSLLIPAEATGAYAVGATRGAVDPNATVMVPIDGLEPFSSQGPVAGHPEIIKPNITAPDAVTTSLAAQDPGLSPFYGTSAAAPHVAGAAALVFSEDALRTADEVEKILNDLALDLPGEAEPDPNNQYGEGRLRLRAGVDSRAPTITIAFPRHGETITTATPTLTAFIQDDGSGVDPTTIRIELNQIEVYNGSSPGQQPDPYDAATGRLSWPDPDGDWWNANGPLAHTNHMIIIDCSDYSANEATSAVTNFRVASATIPGGVHIVSFPYRDLAVTDPSVVLGTPLADLAMVRWWPEDEGKLKYHFYPDTRASLVPPDCTQANMDDRTVPYPPAGLAYFLSLPQTAVLAIEGMTLDDIPSTHIRLYYGQHRPRGWNLIGNPYEQPVNWGTVQFVTDGVRQDLREAIDAGVTEGVLFDYVGPSGGQGGYYSFTTDPTAGALEPMKGYWLHVNQDTRVLVYGGGMGTAAQPTSAQPQAAADGWLVRLCVRAGGYQDPSNYVGVSSAASAGYDPAHDVPEPPALVGTLQMYMPRPGWGRHAGRYAKDVRGTTDSGQWDVEVLCELADSEVEITWPQLNAQVPGEVKLVLEDLDGGRQVYMRTASAYRFRSGPEGCVRHLRIRAETGSDRMLTLSGVAAARAAGGGAVFTYAVSRTAEVTVEVRNIAGRLVKMFTPRRVEGGGQQSLVWNGMSQFGSPVPAGRYLVRLTARAEDGQTVQGIRPFEIMR